jgi:hypothetical protein
MTRTEVNTFSVEIDGNPIKVVTADFARQLEADLELVSAVASVEAYTPDEIRKWLLNAVSGITSTMEILRRGNTLRSGAERPAGATVGNSGGDE